MRSSWALAVAIPLACFAACSSARTEFDDSSDDGGGGGTGDGNSGSSGGGGSASAGPVGMFTAGDASVVATDNGPCRGGKYEGTFAGLYTSHLTGIGVPIPVAGNVDMTLDQEGTAGQQCMVDGEFEHCSDVFSLQNGTITGIADEIHLGDAAGGGFPYYCTMTGTLDCKNKKLDDGWIQCTYCIGPLADGGMACELLNGVAGTTGVGGHFAGPLTANYDYATLAFVMGTWNGAEALAGNDGGSPTPEGGPIANYLSDSGLYLGPTDFGGSGTWNAAYTPRDP
jgi:hypothetical protein